MARRHPLVVSAGSAGFTLTEIVVVIAIVAIVSVFAAAQFTRSGFDTRAVYDQLFAQVSYGRKAAIAQRRPVFVQIDAVQSVLCYTVGSPCGNPVPGPTGPVFTVSFGSAAVTPATFQFDGLGRFLTSAGADPGAPLVITVTGGSTFQFTVERDTGYVHP